MYTLEKVRTMFNAWRATKKKRNEQIPPCLLDLLKDLAPNYAKSHICQELRLSGTQFKKYCLLTSAQEHSNKEHGFAEAILPNALQSNLCEVTLNKTDQTLQLKINIQQLSSLLPLLAQYL